MTPLLVLWLADTSIEVNAVGMFLNILYVTIFPIAIGFTCNYLWGKRAGFKEFQSNMPAVSVIGLALIVGGVIVTVRPQLFANGFGLIALILAVVFLHNGLGYVLGYSVGRLFKFNTAKKRTISIEVGVQNAGILHSNVVCKFQYFQGILFQSRRVHESSKAKNVRQIDFFQDHHRVL